MAPIFWLLLGVVLGTAFLAFARAQADAETRMLAIGLVVAAAIYVGFAFAGAEPRWVAIEVGGVVLYGTIAGLVFGTRCSGYRLGGRFIPCGM